MKKKLVVRQNRNDRLRASVSRWLAIAAAFFGATSALMEKYWSAGPSWVFLSLAIAAAIVAVGLALTKSSSEAQVAETKWQTDARTLLQVEVATETSQIDPYQVGAKLSRYLRGQDPYVERSIDRRVRSVLRGQDEDNYPFVIIAGDPLCGKTRTAFEAIDAVLPALDMIVPREGFKSIRALLDLSPSPEIMPGSVVFWLDDVDDFSSATVGLVSRMRKLGPTVCTVRSKVVDELRLGTAIGSASGRGLLAGARKAGTLFRLPQQLTPEELREAQDTYPEAGISESIGQALTATLQLSAIISASRSRPLTDRRLTRGLTDIALLGAPTELKRSELLVLFACYYGDTWTEAKFQSALTWCLGAEPDGKAAENALLAENGTDTYQVSPYLRNALGEEEDYSLDKAAAQFLLEHFDEKAWLSCGSRALDLGSREVAAEIFERARSAEDPLISQFATIGLAVLSDSKMAATSDLLLELEEAANSSAAAEFEPLGDLAAKLMADRIAEEDPARAFAIYQDLRSRASGVEKASLSLAAARLADDGDEALVLAEEASMLSVNDEELHAEAGILVGQIKYRSNPDLGLEIICRVAATENRMIAAKAASVWLEIVGQPDDAKGRALHERMLREGPASIAAMCAVSLGLRDEKRAPERGRQYFATAAEAQVADLISYMGCRGWIQALLNDPDANIERELNLAAAGSKANIAAMATLQQAYRVGKNDLRFVQAACQRVMEGPNTFLAHRAAGYLASIIRKQRPQAAERLLEPLLSSVDDEIRTNARFNMVRVIRKRQPERARQIAEEILSEASGERRLEDALKLAHLFQTVDSNFAHDLFTLAATSEDLNTRCGAKIFLAGYMRDISMQATEDMIEEVIAEGIPHFSVVACITMCRLWFEEDRERSDWWGSRAGDYTHDMPEHEGDEPDDGDFDLDDWD